MLPWVRLDSNIATHDKILDLIDDPSPKKWQAITSYVFALAWSGGHGTDGKINDSALGAVHGTQATARLLEKHRLWERGTACWHIRNFEQRQQLTAVAEAKRNAQKLGGVKGNCVRHHGPDCHCWKDSV